MKEIILVKYGEIALKGLNKSNFERLLLGNIKRRLRGLGKFTFSHAQSTVTITPIEEPGGAEPDMDEATARLQQVYGIAALARACVLPKDFDQIAQNAPAYLEDTLQRARTFKVEAKRSDKKFPMDSPALCRELGGILLEHFPHLTVDVKHPEVTVTVEIRDTHAFIHALRIPGAGGIPVGSSGQALLLLSGGIDSPVAGCMVAKRGVHIAAIHYVSPPYTSERARLKVEKLCQEMTPWCGAIRFYCVPFTELQEEIRDHCPEELFTLIMRRLMVEIAQRIALKFDFSALVTGESIGQVASQTMDAMICTDAAARIPIFRPVIGMDKNEIVVRARQLGTFETSIEPYEDCCSVFSPKHPKTRPSLSEVEEAQNAFDFEPAIQRAIAGIEMKTFRPEWETESL